MPGQSGMGGYSGHKRNHRSLSTAASATPGDASTMGMDPKDYAAMIKHLQTVGPQLGDAPYIPLDANPNDPKFSQRVEDAVRQYRVDHHSPNIGNDPASQGYSVIGRPEAKTKAKETPGNEKKLPRERLVSFIRPGLGG